MKDSCAVRVVSTRYRTDTPACERGRLKRCVVVVPSAAGIEYCVRVPGTYCAMSSMKNGPRAIPSPARTGTLLAWMWGPSPRRSEVTEKAEDSHESPTKGRMPLFLIAQG